MHLPAEQLLLVESDAEALLMRMRQPETVQAWPLPTLRAWAQHEQFELRRQTDDSQHGIGRLRARQDRFLNLRLADEIDTETFTAKNNDLRDEIAKLSASADPDQGDKAVLAEKAIALSELSQELIDKWLTGDCAEKRQLPDFVFLNFTLDGETLTPTMRKHFDLPIAGLFVPSSRGDRPPVEFFVRFWAEIEVAASLA